MEPCFKFSTLGYKSETFYKFLTTKSFFNFKFDTFVKIRTLYNYKKSFYILLYFSTAIVIIYQEPCIKLSCFLTQQIILLTFIEKKKLKVEIVRKQFKMSQIVENFNKYRN